MKYAKTADYLNYFEELFEKCKKEGKKSITLTAKEVHKAVSEGPTLPTCCAAMRKVMKKTDKIIVDIPPKKAGSAFKVEYNLIDRDKAESMFPPAKRGRPTGTVQKVHKEFKKEKIKTIDDILMDWLQDINVNFEKNKNMYTIDGEYGKWIILTVNNAKPFSETLYSLLKLKSDNVEKCSICIEGNIKYEKGWNELPVNLRKNLNITMLKCNKRGKLTEIE